MLVISCFFIPTLSTTCYKSERKAILSIYSAAGIPVDAGSPQLTSDCCQWQDITCNQAGHVTGMGIYSQQSSGHISPSVGDLTYLNSLSIRKVTNLTGNIPFSITKLTSLTFLRLDWNSLSGPVPSFLSQLTKLDYLNLAFNHFSGSIPSSLGALQLSFIRIDRNKLTGPIPESIASIPNAEYLYLSHNNLSGTIPKAFSNAKFSVVDLSRNSLSGDASLFFGKNKPLTRLDLSRNMFEFDLSKVKLPKDIVELDLNHNKIYGGIPTSFTKFLWQNFNVSYNRLCGEIPTGGRFDDFDATTFFHNRCLCGPPLLPCK